MTLINTDINLIETLSANYQKGKFETAEKLTSIKDEALKYLKNHGLPDHKNEEYKYFNVLRKINRNYSFELPEPDAENTDWVE